MIFLIGLGKGGLGGSIGILATPLMTLVLPADQVIGLLLPVLMLADVFAVATHWRRWDTQLVVLLLPGSIVGMLIGTMFIASISPDMLRRGIGVIVLLFVIYRLFEQPVRRYLQYQPRNWHGFLAGSIAGLVSTLAHVGGPPIAIYLLMQNISPRVFVATTALFFAVVNWIKVPSYIYLNLINLSLLGQIVWLLPLLPVSVWVGKQIAYRVNKVVFDRIIVFLLAVSAAYLLIS